MIYQIEGIEASLCLITGGSISVSSYLQFYGSASDSSASGRGDDETMVDLANGCKLNGCKLTGVPNYLNNMRQLEPFETVRQQFFFLVHGIIAQFSTQVNGINLSLKVSQHAPGCPHTYEFVCRGFPWSWGSPSSLDGLHGKSH